MANGHGGQRTPAHPAVVSGPGALSRRTDGGPSQVMSVAPNQDYGDMSQQLNDQRIAPMAGTPPLPPAPVTTPPKGGAPSGGGGGGYQGGPFDGPSTRPNEPVTTGVPVGPGAGPEALSLGPVGQSAPATGQMTQLLSSLVATDTTGVLAPLLQQASARGA